MGKRSSQWRAGVLLGLALLFASGAAFVVWRLTTGTPNAQGDPPLLFNQRAAIAIDIDAGASRDRVDAALERVARESPDYQDLAPTMQDALLQQALPLATFTFTRSFDAHMELVESLGGAFKPHFTPENIENIRAQWERKNWRSVDPSHAQFWLRRRDGDYPRFSARYATQKPSSFDFGLDDDMMGSKKSAMVEEGAPVIYLTIPVERTAPTGEAAVEQLWFSFVWDESRSLWLPYTVRAYSDDRPRSVFF